METQVGIMWTHCYICVNSEVVVGAVRHHGQLGECGGAEAAGPFPP